MKALLLIPIIAIACLLPLRGLFAVTLGGLETTAGAAHIAGSPKDPSEIAATVIAQVLSFIGVLFLGLMVWGGLTWMTAGGNEEQVKKATKIITAAVVGLVIVLSAYAITRFVGQSVGTTTN